MSITPPGTYTYGTVVGRFLKTIVDSADADRYPDVIASTGTVTFTPKVAYYKNLTLPATFITTSVVGTLDSAGYLIDSLGALGVVLTDPSSPGISPSGWTYAVSMSIDGKTLPSFDITVAGGTTIDLTTVMPAAISTGTVTIVTEASRLAAEAAAAAAAQSAIDAANASGGLNTEAAQDVVGAMVVGSGYVSTTYNDAAGTLTIASTSALTTDLAAKAPLASPALTGNPTAPTPTAGDSDTSIATTAFVTGAISTSAATKANTTHTHAESDITNLVTDLAAKAPLASPALTGNPTAPTPTAGDNDTSIATTAFVSGAITTSAATKSDKSLSAGFRVKSGSTDVGAGPGWTVRPTGYALVVSVGADPSPTDQVAGDSRWIPAP